MSKRLYLVGVGPGSPKYLTDIVKDVIKKSHYIIGYKHTLNTISHLINEDFHKTYQVTMKNQDEIYNIVFNKMENDECCVVPFTGDVNFSESEVVDRLLQIFGEDSVELIPGISSIQIAASRTKIPLDKSIIITFHVTEEIEEKKKELLNAVINKKSVILLPRPWNNDPKKEFMQSDVAVFLKKNGIKTQNIFVWIFEFLTTEKEKVFRGKLNELENLEFDALSVMVIDYVQRKTYLEFG